MLYWLLSWAEKQQRPGIYNLILAFDSSCLGLFGVFSTRQTVNVTSALTRSHHTLSHNLNWEFFGCKTIRIFAYSRTREQSNEGSWARLKTESKTGRPWAWACEARAACVACKAGVFCSAIHDSFFFRNDVFPPSWTLILPESWDESKTDIKGEVDGYKIEEGEGRKKYKKYFILSPPRPFPPFPPLLP